MPAGYTFSLLGGLLGVAIGGALWQSKIADAAGQKVSKYNAAARRHGIAMIVLGSVSFAVSAQLYDKIGGGDMDPPRVTAPSSSGGGQTAPSPSGGGQTTPTQPATGGGQQPAASGGETTLPGGIQPSRPSAGGGSQPTGGTGLAGLGLTPTRAPSNEYEELVLDYLNSAYENNLQTDGFSPAIHRHFGNLSQGGSEDVSIQLPASSQIAIFGACDNECSDFNFMLFSQDGRMVDEDTTTDDIPLVVAETGASGGSYTLRIDMASCSIAPCYYAVGVYRR